MSSGSDLIDLLADLPKNWVGGIIALVIAAVFVFLCYATLAPRTGTYLVVHGDSCWIVKDILHVELDSGEVWWRDAETKQRISIYGARYAQVSPGRLAEVAKTLGAQNCLATQNP